MYPGTHYRLVLALIVLVYVSGCKPKEVAERKPSDSLMIQFSQSPPVVQDIFIQKLDKADKNGNTVLLTVKFADDENRLREINSIPLKLDEQTLVEVNDRGVEGDEKADDKIFSISVKISEEELAELLNNNNKVLDAQHDSITTFVGRVAEVRTGLRNDMVKSLTTKFNFEVFFLSSVNSTTLPSIRERSLMITDVSVVEDKTRTYDPCLSANKGNADGVWSFKTLITNMTAGGVTPKQFLIDWVEKFLYSEHTLPSGDKSQNRGTSLERLVKAWMINSGVPFTEPENFIPAGWQTTDLKVEAFPVRLLAIINRLDLRENAAYGGIGNSGEGRFVFSFVDSHSNCAIGGNGAGTMTFILEYGIPIKTCDALVEYGSKWWELQSEPFGPAYNEKLDSITNVFTAKDANPAKPNGSALNHFRTNDFLPQNPTGMPWTIRDFQIDGTTHKLKIIHPSHEPMQASNGFDFDLSGTPMDPVKLAAMVTFANSLPFSSANPNPTYFIPNNIKAIHAPMRVGPDVDYHWRGDRAHVITPLKRREFSFNTCSGCHKGETNNDFTHVRTRNVGEAAALSGFMTGLGADDSPSDGADTSPTGKFWVNDPGPSPLSRRGFNEALFRAKKLEELVFESSCSKRRAKNQLAAIERTLRFRPLNMEH